MGDIGLNKIQLTTLKRVPVEGGDVLHALKCSESSFVDFGEAYFSIVEMDVVKAWKLHHKMTMNFIVPIGNIRFVFVSSDLKERREECIGISNYVRLTIPPRVWFGFEGVYSPSSLLLNIANIEHDPDEVERIDIAKFKLRFN